MRCLLGSCVNEKNVKKLCALGQWVLLLGVQRGTCVNRFGGPTRTYVVGYCSVEHEQISLNRYIVFHWILMVGSMCDNNITKRWGYCNTRKLTYTHTHKHTHTHIHTYTQAHTQAHKTHTSTHRYTYNLFIYIFVYTCIYNAVCQQCLSITLDELGISIQSSYLNTFLCYSNTTCYYTLWMACLCNSPSTDKIIENNPLIHAMNS